MDCYIRHIFVRICCVYYCILQFIEISGSSEQFLNKTNYCHLDIFSTAKLGPNKEIEFDVSRLNKRVWFNIPFTKKDGTNYTFHFSLCRPEDAGQLSTPCTESDSLACVSRSEGDTRKEVVHNAGTHLSGFIYDDSQLHLSLVKSSEKCSGSDVYQTILKITCSKFDQDPVLHIQDLCTFVVLWNHSAACPIQDTGLQKACVFHYLGNRYDFRPLRHKAFYQVKRKKKNYSREFQINICGHINGGKCQEPNVSVCEMNSDIGTAIAASNTKMVYNTTELLGFVLQYLDEAGNVKAEVNFQCYNLSMNHKFNLMGSSTNATVHEFKLQTSIACLMDPYSHCIVSSTDDNSFNLYILRNEYENHVIGGYKEGIKYIVNFCGPLLEQKQYDCDGLICMWDLSTNTSLIVGTQVLPLKVVGASLIYEIVGGDYCPQEGTHRAVFTLECHYKEQPPQFTGWQADCTHLFNWKTPAACPYKHVEAQDCKIRVSSAGQDFDLKPTRKTTEDYKVTKDKDIFYMNLCGPMNVPCGETNTSSVCWSHEGADTIAVGHYKGRQPEYINGQIFLSMEGDACKTNGPNKSHVVILFTLEMDSNKILPPHLFMMDLDRCFFYFVWPVLHSWTPQHKNDICSATDHRTNDIYDLRSLTRTNSNYLINYNPNGDNSIIILNVCQPIVPGPEIVSNFGWGVCLFNRSKTTIREERFLSLGDVGWPVFKDDMLRIQYKHGSVLCPFVSTHTNSQYETSIDFICDPNIENSEPKLVEVNLCKYRFVWKTKAACPIKPSRLLTNEPMQEDQQPIQCSASTPDSDFRIDLRPLMDDDYDVQTDGGLLKFAVCRSLPCGLLNSEAGACLNGVSTGIANNILQYSKGKSFIIEYNNGGPCGKKTYTTIIQFICNPNVPLARPEIVSLNDKCTFLIRFETPLACEKKIGCVAESDNPDYAFNLSPLIDNNKNYQIKVGNYIFFINVCRPLLVVDNLDCPTGSSICRTNLENGTYANEASFGYLTTSPEVKEDKSIWLKYNQGDTCVENSHEQYSTLIKFVCDHNMDIGKPRIHTSNSCEYIFEWKTSYACADKKNQFASQVCLIYDSKDHQIMNMTSDKYKRAFKITSALGSRYKFQLCSSSGDLRDFLFRRIGNSWYSLGVPDDVVFRYPENSTIIKIRNGTKCTDKENFYAEVTLKCDQHHNPHTSKPYIRLESTCTVFIEWANWDLCYHNLSGPGVISEDTVFTTLTIDPAVVLLPDPSGKVTDAITVAKTTNSHPFSVTDSSVTASTKPTIADQGTSYTLIILKIIVVITIIVILLAVVVYFIKKRPDETSVERPVSLGMVNLSSPGSSNGHYTRNLLPEGSGSDSSAIWTEG